jgi:hypothetical protein
MSMFKMHSHQFWRLSFFPSHLHFLTSMRTPNGSPLKCGSKGWVYTPEWMLRYYIVLQMCPWVWVFYLNIKKYLSKTVLILVILLCSYWSTGLHITSSNCYGAMLWLEKWDVWGKTLMWGLIKENWQTIKRYKLGKLSLCMKWF